MALEMIPGFVVNTPFIPGDDEGLVKAWPRWRHASGTLWPISAGHPPSSSLAHPQGRSGGERHLQGWQAEPVVTSYIDQSAQVLGGGKGAAAPARRDRLITRGPFLT
jgi:hypothetical protein